MYFKESSDFCYYGIKTFSWMIEQKTQYNEPITSPELFSYRSIFDRWRLLENGLNKLVHLINRINFSRMLLSKAQRSCQVFVISHQIFIGQKLHDSCEIPELLWTHTYFRKVIFHNNRGHIIPHDENWNHCSKHLWSKFILPSMLSPSLEDWTHH